MTAPAAEQEIARELRIRAPQRPVTRLSRKVLIVLGVTVSVAVAGATFWAMTERPGVKAKGELYQTENQNPPEGLATLPPDYARAPKLGPPLPGDLGRPMLGAGQAASSPMPGSTATGPVRAPTSAAQQQRVQEREAARTSHLFSGERAQTESPPPAAANPPKAAADPAPMASPSLPGPAGNLAFLTGGIAHETTSDERLQAPASPYVVQAGAVIAAALITGLRSDLPGQITAQVTQDVYDSPTGRFLLIPQGARLVGTYDSQVAFGQNRVLLAWTRLILPGGRSIVLGKEPGADSEGLAGLEDGVDHHWRQLFGAALLSTIMGVGAEAGASQSDSQILEALRQGAVNSLNQVGQQVVGKSLEVQPTLSIRPGFPVRVIVTRDLVLEPIIH
jgi:type IV secretion system protein VirB10